MSSGSSHGVLVGVVLGAGMLAVGMVAVLGAVFWFTAQEEPAQVVRIEAAEPVVAEAAQDSGRPTAEEPAELPDEPVEVADEEPVDAPLEVEDDAPEPPPSTRTTSTKKKKECKPNGKGIKQLGPHKWQVKRSVIERYTGNMKAAEKLASVKWAKNKSGKTTGVRLTRVPCKSPLRAAGLRSKDLILSVGGQKVTSVPQGLRVWASIRRDDSFTVKIRRKGTSTVHRYVLVN